MPDHRPPSIVDDPPGSPLIRSTVGRAARIRVPRTDASAERWNGRCNPRGVPRFSLFTRCAIACASLAGGLLLACQPSLEDGADYEVVDENQTSAPSTGDDEDTDTQPARGADETEPSNAPPRSTAPMSSGDAGAAKDAAADARVCKASGLTCTTASQCCTGLCNKLTLIEADPRYCCAYEGACKTDSDCCGYMQCKSGKCAKSLATRTCISAKECASGKCTANECE
jgi:hypothetical protein